MNYFDAVLRDVPVVAYKLNGAGTGYTNIAGGVGTYAGTNPTLTAPVLSGSTKSSLMSNAKSTNFTARNIWVKGGEQRPFSLECVVMPVKTSATQIDVYSHTGEGDGIYLTKDVLGFLVKFTAGTVKVEWNYPDFAEAWHVVATYTPARIQLWVNGSMVAEETIPSGHVDSGFSFTTANFYTGTGGGAGDSFAVDGYAAYNYVLEESQIETHFEEARDVVTMDSNVAFFGGSYRDGTGRNVFQQVRFDTSQEWLFGDTVNVSTMDDTLKPIESQDPATLGQSMAGTWTGKFEFDTTDVTITGIKAEWNGNGNFTVQSSLDGGSTWSAVTNGELIAASQGLNPATTPLVMIRVTFAGGVVSDISSVTDLTLTAYRDNYIYGMDNSRPLLIVATTSSTSTSLEVNQPIERNQRAGMHFNGNGRLTLQPDTQEVPVPTAALEFWIKPDGVLSGTGGYVFDTRGAGGTAYMWLQESSTTWGWAGASSVYINGALASSGVAAKKGEWTHILFNLSATNNTDVTIGAGNIIADMNLIATYPAALSASDALLLFNNYQTQAVASITEAAVPVIFEPANPFAMTSLDWATLPQQ